ncbi:PQQ-binding-like beta-propeller repeat protein [Actinosynnema sp. NPDC020468]|uniref:outer membrane protein assembly factor BamB family protein n=1 Tax=Actinosynnema sp. NPDC020468 TaxID=3154488 RepID=UPI0033EA1B1C
MLRYVMLAGAGCALVSLFLPVAHPRPEGLDIPLAVWVAGLAAAVALARAGFRAAAVLCGGAVLVGVGIALVVDVGHGLPAPDVPVLAVGALAVAVGAGWWGTTWRPTALGALAVVPVVGLALVAPALADHAAVRSHVREAWAEPAAPVAETPGDRRWTWQPPGRVLRLVPAGHGVAVVTTWGVITGVVDGRAEWTYARSGADVADVRTSADLRTLVVAFRGAANDENTLVVVLDADTGAVRFQRPVRSPRLWAGTRSLIEAEAGTVTAYDVVSGDVRWRRDSVEGCRTADLAGVGRTVAVVRPGCTDRDGLVGLSEDTGDVVWSTLTPFAPGLDLPRRPSTRAKATPTGGAVLVERSGDRPPGVGDTAVLDTLTGKVTEASYPGMYRLDVGALPIVVPRSENLRDPIRLIDPVSGVVRDVQDDCKIFNTAATGTRTLLRVCHDGERLEVRTDGVDGTTTGTRVPELEREHGVVAQVAATPGAVVVTGFGTDGVVLPVVGLAR